MSLHLIILYHTLIVPSTPSYCIIPSHVLPPDYTVSYPYRSLHLIILYLTLVVPSIPSYCIIPSHVLPPHYTVSYPYRSLHLIILYLTLVVPSASLYCIIPSHVPPPDYTISYPCSSICLIILYCIPTHIISLIYKPCYICIHILHISYHECIILLVDSDFNFSVRCWSNKAKITSSWSTLRKQCTKLNWITNINFCVYLNMLFFLLPKCRPFKGLVLYCLSVSGWGGHYCIDTWHLSILTMRSNCTPKQWWLFV